MSHLYVCRKCGRTYTREDFNQDRFCRACGTFLTLAPVQTRLTETVGRPRPTSGETAGHHLKIPSRQLTSEESTRRTIEMLNDESNETIVLKPTPFINYLDPHNIRKLIDKGQYSSFEKFNLNLRAQEIKKIGTIDKLITMDMLRTKIDAHPYQMKVALSVLQEMNTNGILADEVGLGKTIEAGIIMKELLVRGMVNSILIIVPKSLLSQWKREMAEKFGEKFVIANDKKEFVDFDTDDRIICSSGLMVRRFDEIERRNWDLVIVDEAHTYRNTKSKGRQHLSIIPKTYVLLLTATPLCNKLTDLYSLIDLIHPGLMETERSFISRYVADNKGRIVRPSAVDELRHTVYNMMCRTRRAETDIPFTKRHVESRRIDANETEREFIEQVTEYLKGIGNNRFKTIEQLEKENPARRITELQSKAILILQAISMQQSLSSSPAATIASLRKRYDRYPSENAILSSLIELGSHVQSSKLELLKNVLGETGNEQALIFCSRKTTVTKLSEVLNQDFGKAVMYIGDMGSSARDEAIQGFREGKTRYLVATDAAAEGLNLQNCNIMFNYDLHWNPMKIEQRIGRIHRFGQERDVTIFNLSVRDTIDDYVLHILYQKIDLFNITIGKMETVLAEMKEGTEEIEKTIMEILLRSTSRIDIKQELEKLSNDINYAREKQELAEKFTKGVLG